jgi:hypothetical protein
MRTAPPNRLVHLALILAAVGTVAADDAPTATDWHALDKLVGTTGVLKDDVYTFTVPRTDLDVAVDGMAVPAAAGIASELRFFRCSCGKTRVVGQLCVADYELNDVLDAVHAGGLIQVASVGPMFLADKPRVMMIRFQGEGEATALARLLKAGLDWTGDARLTAQAASPATTQPTK